MDKSILRGSGLIYSGMAEHHADLIRLAKAYIAAFIKRQREIPDYSLWQHLAADSLLYREAQAFLGMDRVEAQDIRKLTKEIGDKADSSMLAGTFLPVEYLCRLFGMNGFERFVFIMVTASYMDAGFSKIYAYLQNDWDQTALSAQLAAAIYSCAENDLPDENLCLGKQSLLSRHLLHFDSASDRHRLKQGLLLKSQISSFIFGDGELPEKIKGFASYYAPNQELDEIVLKEKPYERMINYMKKTGSASPVLFYLYGAPGIGKKLNIKYYARENKQSVLFVDFEALAARVRYDTGLEKLEELLQTVLTEAIIRQGLICISSSSRQSKDDKENLLLLNNIINYIKEETGLFFLSGDCDQKLRLSFDRLDIIPVRLEAASLDDYYAFWKEVMQRYKFEEDVKAEDFSSKYILTAGQIKNICDEAKRLAVWKGREKISRQLLLDVCRNKLEHNLGKKASKVKLVYDWDDLVLPQQQINMLKMACSQIRYRYKVLFEWGYIGRMPYGTGLSMIFSGPPGTGKTMAAQVMARELELELYKVELAAVVSKYIGETERNLNEIFEEAQKSQAVIFFDEADVLFSKRSEVKDSNDKYSNMEAAFMLQKIEEYTGIVILATNYQQNIDEAFKRRIKFLIDFCFPDSHYRKILWLKAFPEQLPIGGDIDYDFLAKNFELTGSNIRNIALNAAYLAAEQGSGVAMPHIIRAIVNEFGKSGKKLSRQELGEYYTDYYQ